MPTVKVDPAGRFNQLVGTDDVDIFVFPADGNTDAIVGFEDGKDVIAFFSIEGLGFDDLMIRDGREGKVTIEYDNGTGTIEKIVMKSNAAGFSAADLTEADFSFEVPPEAQPPETTNDITDRPNAFTQLAGTAANDRFVMIADGNNDAIIGFSDGNDVIDLSAYGLAGFADLSIRDGRAGKVIIEHASPAGGTEKITLKGNEAGFSAASLDETDFLFAPEAPQPPANEITDPQSAFSQLVGTSGPDQFVFPVDGNNDAILGFGFGNDVIDLSAVAGLGFADLAIRDGRDGKVTITYDTGAGETEKITLKDNENGFFAARLTEDDFIFA